MKATAAVIPPYKTPINRRMRLSAIILSGVAFSDRLFGRLKLGRAAAHSRSTRPGNAPQFRRFHAKARKEIPKKKGGHGRPFSFVKLNIAYSFSKATTVPEVGSTSITWSPIMA